MLNRIRRKLIFYWYEVGRHLRNADVKKYIKATLISTLIALIFLKFNPWFYSHKKIENSTLNALVFVSSVILAGLALLDEFSSIVNGRSIKILLIVFACDLAWISSNKKDDQNDAEKSLQTKTDSAFKASSSTKDSIRNVQRNKLYQDSLTSGLNRMAKIFTDALDKDQGKYENARQQIVDLVKRDSAKQIVYNSQTRPVLDITNILLVKKTADSLVFQLKLEARQATAYDVNLQISVIQIDKYGLATLIKQTSEDYQSEEQLESGKQRTAVIGCSNDAFLRSVVFRVFGYYTDFVNRSQKIPFDKVIYYDVILKQMRTPPNDVLKQLRMLFKRK